MHDLPKTQDYKVAAENLFSLNKFISPRCLLSYLTQMLKVTVVED